MKSIISDWKVTFLGRGSFADVFLYRYKETGYRCAMKKVKYNLSGRYKEIPTEIRNLQHEMSTIIELHHKNIVKHLATGIFKDCLCIAMEYMSKGSLREQIDENKAAFDEAKTNQYTLQILRGLDYLHSQEEPIIHGDLKCANVLLDEKGCVKLCDFGTARRLQLNASKSGSRDNTPFGTYHFSSPEVVSATDRKISTKSDIWSAGCTIVEMLTTRPPWWNDTSDKPGKMIILMSQRKEPTYKLPENVSKGIRISLKEHFFKYEPSERKDAKFLLGHIGELTAEDSEQFETAKSNITEDMDNDKVVDKQENKEENQPMRGKMGMRDRSETGYSVNEEFKNTTTTINEDTFM